MFQQFICQTEKVRWPLQIYNTKQTNKQTNKQKTEKVKWPTKVIIVSKPKTKRKGEVAYTNL